jgi:hypothetical protein
MPTGSKNQLTATTLAGRGKPKHVQHLPAALGVPQKSDPERYDDNRGDNLFHDGAIAFQQSDPPAHLTQFAREGVSALPVDSEKAGAEIEAVSRNEQPGNQASPAKREERLQYHVARGQAAGNGESQCGHS